MAAQNQDKEVGFKEIQLHKNKILGIGTCGKVCQAECDGLLCAAKLYDETLLGQTEGQREQLKRFEQECEFLSTIRHPNIIQYLGMYQDPDTRLPVLLMELMDDSLTHFLEGSPQPILYHIQVNICHDVTLALSFLHSNGIVHRNLSSNNLLMIGDARAKVTDFGMAKLGLLNSQLTSTLCPGTDVYMPPEAFKERSVYSEKIDCFSFGVIAVQIMTRLFPQPDNRQQRGKILSELERRQNHIKQIDSKHPILAIACNCLSDRDVERPSALELCKLLSSLKESADYSESARLIDDTLRQQHEIQKLREQQEEEIQLLEREKSREVEELMRQVEQMRTKRSEAQEQLRELESQIEAII